VLAALLSVVYLDQRQQSLTSDVAAIPIQTLHATTSEPNPQTSPVNSIANSVTEPSLAEQSPDVSSSAGTVAALADASITKATSVRANEASARAAADAPANQSGPVIVRLTNGSTIRADDAGETKTGFWYRQGGMVTFLKRNQVRAIERRRSSSSSPAKVSAQGKNEKTASARPTGGENQLRLRRLPPATVKRESRVTSFLKKTGQILSKPFKR